MTYYQGQMTQKLHFKWGGERKKYVSLPCKMAVLSHNTLYKEMK